MWTSEDTEAVNGLMTLICSVGYLDECEVLLACSCFVVLPLCGPFLQILTTHGHYQDMDRFRGMCTSVHLKQLEAMQPSCCGVLAAAA